MTTRTFTSKNKFKLSFMGLGWGFLLFWSFAGFAQNPMSYLDQIPQHLYDIGETQDLNTPGANDNILGITYNQGLGVDKNPNKAFDLIQKAARTGNTAAQYNLGRFYMIGTGCNIDFDQAIHWFTLAANAGNERAAYGLGYMYYKGFGVKQDYKKAIWWLELSTWPMAKCLLGESYLYGFGTPKDQDKAIINFTKSQTTNAKMMLNHMVENAKATQEATLNAELKQTQTPNNTALDTDVITKSIAPSTVLAGAEKKLKPAYFNGDWKGKLLELDWSGTQIISALPVQISFKTEGETINYSFTINGVTTQNTAILEDNALYYNNLNMTFIDPMHQDPATNKVVWQLLSSQMQFKTITQKAYLTANVQTFSNHYLEQGPPMKLVLKPADDADDDFTAEQLLALADQKDHFIVLYPNPFIDNVLVEYELDQAATVSVQVYGISGNPTSLNLEPGSTQTQGKHHYTLNGSGLLTGMYVVKVTVDGIPHSRILIKQ